MRFVDPKALLAPTTCTTCGLTYLTAEVDATSNLEPAHPLRIAPVLLAPTTCTTCGLTYLTAKVDATSNTEPHRPLRVAPVLLAPEHIAHAIVHNLRLYKVSATLHGPVAGEWHYTQPALSQATRERTRPKYDGPLGIATQHIHHSDPPGQSIDVPDRDNPPPDPRLELLARKQTEYPELARILENVLDPPPF